MQGGRDKFKKGRSYTYSETDVDELEESDRRCANFLRECLLPIAVQTNALVRERERERERGENERERCATFLRERLLPIALVAPRPTREPLEIFRAKRFV